MKKKKVPLRKCVVTKEMKKKKEMVRIVKNKEDGVSIDPTGKKNGRGAYVSLDPDIIEDARKNREIDKSLSVQLSDEFYDELSDYIIYQHARKQIEQ